MPKKGDHWYNNGTVQILCGENEVPLGYVKGVLPKCKEHLKQISNNQKGVSKSDDTKRKISENAKKRFSDKENHPMYGKHHSTETIYKISESKKGEVSHQKGIIYTQEQIDRRNDNIINKYGSLDAFNSVCVEKSRETKLKNHGDSNYNNREKACLTIAQDKDFYKKRSRKTKATIESRYGSRSELQKVNRMRCAEKMGFSTIEEYNSYWRNLIAKCPCGKENSLEHRIREFLQNNNFSFKEQYNLSNGKISHTFDFAIFKGDSLNILLDVDGLYFHGYLSDVNGKSVNNYSDDYRQMLVPSDVKFMVIIEGNEEAGYAEILKTYDMDYVEYISDIFQWCREEGFPYASYDNKILTKSYESLCNSDVSKFSMKARYGEKLISHFYKSIYFAHKYGKKSPFEAWEDDETLIKCIKNRIIYKGHSLDRSRVLAGFSTSGVAPKVSVFNPYLAKYLVSKYLSDYAVIFDPFAGYGGRLLGTTSLGKEYIGQDINVLSVGESNEMIDFLKLNASVKRADSLSSHGSHPCLFTCPPYSDKEIWGSEEISHTCDEWIDICLNNFSCECYLFVVDETEKYKDYIVETIVNKSHFSDSVEYVIKINK